MKEKFDDDYQEYFDSKKRPFYKDKKFWIGFVCSVGLFAIFAGLDYALSTSYKLLLSMMIAIPYAVLGLILWAIIRIKSKALALGLMFGCTMPIVAIFVMTGGCGLVRL